MLGRIDVFFMDDRSPVTFRFWLIIIIETSCSFRPRSPEQAESPEARLLVRAIQCVGTTPDKVVASSYEDDR